MTQEKLISWREKLNKTRNSLTEILLEIYEYIEHNLPPLENIQNSKELLENFTKEEITIILLYKEVMQELANLSTLN